MEGQKRSVFSQLTDKFYRKKRKKKRRVMRNGSTASVASSLPSIAEEELPTEESPLPAEITRLLEEEGVIVTEGERLGSLRRQVAPDHSPEGRILESIIGELLDSDCSQSCAASYSHACDESLNPFSPSYRHENLLSYYHLRPSPSHSTLSSNCSSNVSCCSSMSLGELVESDEEFSEDEGSFVRREEGSDEELASPLNLLRNDQVSYPDMSLNNRGLISALRPLDSLPCVTSKDDSVPCTLRPSQQPTLGNLHMLQPALGNPIPNMLQPALGNPNLFKNVRQSSIERLRTARPDRAMSHEGAILDLPSPNNTEPSTSDRAHSALEDIVFVDEVDALNLSRACTQPCSDLFLVSLKEQDTLNDKITYRNGVEEHTFVDMTKYVFPQRASERFLDIRNIFLAKHLVELFHEEEEGKGLKHVVMPFKGDKDTPDSGVDIRFSEVIQDDQLLLKERDDKDGFGDKSGYDGKGGFGGKGGYDERLDEGFSETGSMMSSEDRTLCPSVGSWCTSHYSSMGTLLAEQGVLSDEGDDVIPSAPCIASNEVSCEEEEEEVEEEVEEEEEEEDEKEEEEEEVFLIDLPHDITVERVPWSADCPPSDVELYPHIYPKLNQLPEYFQLAPGVRESKETPGVRDSEETPGVRGSEGTPGVRDSEETPGVRDSEETPGVRDSEEQYLELPSDMVKMFDEDLPSIINVLQKWGKYNVVIEGNLEVEPKAGVTTNPIYFHITEGQGEGRKGLRRAPDILESPQLHELGSPNTRPHELGSPSTQPHTLGSLLAENNPTHPETGQPITAAQAGVEGCSVLDKMFTIFSEKSLEDVNVFSQISLFCRECCETHVIEVL